MHRGSWGGTLSDREPLKRTASLPSLVTQWTCIRCLLDNSCSSLICAACDASSSIAQTDRRQIGARKSKKINLHKENRLKITSGLLANALDGGAGTSGFGNDDKINNTGKPHQTQRIDYKIHIYIFIFLYILYLHILYKNGEDISLVYIFSCIYYLYTYIYTKSLS